MTRTFYMLSDITLRFIKILTGILLLQSLADPEGGRGSGPLLKILKNIRFLSNTGSVPLKHHKATKPTFNFGPLSARQPTLFKWRFAGGPMMVSL